MEGDPVVQVVLIAESSRLQMMLSTYGIDTQTPHDLEPVRIWSSWRMVKVCCYLKLSIVTKNYFFHFAFTTILHQLVILYILELLSTFSVTF